MSFVCVVMWHFGGSLCVTEERHRHFWIQDWLHFVLFFVFFPDYVSSPLCTHVLWYSHLISMWWTCIHISFYKTTQICLTRVFIHDVSCSCVLIDRHMMERTRHPVSLATLHVMAWWVISSTVHPIACGLSSTAMPLEQVRASASHTQVSCLRIFWLIRNVEIQFFSPLHL